MNSLEKNINLRAIIKKVIKSFRNYFQYGILQLLFPRFCVGCGRDYLFSSHWFCLACFHNLPWTGYENQRENPVYRKMSLFTDIHTAYSLLFYSKESISQRILVQIKYQRNISLALFFGEKLAEVFFESQKLKNVDVLIPIPLTKKRLRWRGYNQAELLCQGIQKKLPELNLEKNCLERKYFHQSQTKIHSSYLRFINVKEAFIINKKKLQNWKHIVIIDDVLTTGSTLSICVALFHQVLPNAKISILTLATAIRE